MKDLNLIIWITQLGLSVASPLAGMTVLAVWLHRSCGWGTWVIWVGLMLGIISAVGGLRTSLKILERMSRSPKDPQPPAASCNDHE